MYWLMTPVKPLDTFFLIYTYLKQSIYSVFPYSLVASISAETNKWYYKANTIVYKYFYWTMV